MTVGNANFFTGSAELLALTQAFCDGTLRDTDQEQLERLLRQDRAAQQFFLAHVDLHARLCWEAGRGIPLEDRPLPNSLPPRLPMGLSLGRVFIVGGSLLLVLAILVFWRSWSPPTVVVPDPASALRATDGLARVVNAAGRWNERAEVIRIGEILSGGVVDLAQGIIELEYQSGVRLVVQSPARLELIDGNRMYLHSGRVVVMVPSAAVGFVVDSAKTRVIDLGTEFGISVQPDGVTQVQVFEGVVDAEFKDVAGRQVRVERLTSGQARVFDTSTKAATEPVPFVPQRFVRRFPVSQQRGGPQTPFNHSRFEAIHVGRARTPPVIDGDLRDWDRTRMFVSRCLDPYGEHYFVQGLLAYDDHRIYVGAHVGDPSPMASVIDPEKDPSYFWAGGSVVLRMATSASFGWPFGTARDRPDESSEQISHLVMWYSQPMARARLVQQFGMVPHAQHLSQEGWQGAFRKDPDGLGYTMEYAIDWSLLHTEVPRPGAEWPASWTVHWSDRDGRTCMGQLVEITNFGRKPYQTFQAATWGKLIFDKPAIQAPGSK